MGDIQKLKEKLSELENLLETIELDLEDTSNDTQLRELGDLPYRVIHYKHNPFSQCIEKEDLEYEELKEENERLRARLSLVESGNNMDVTMRIDEAVNNAHQIELLKRQLVDYKEREDKITSALGKTARDFREACFSLIGYRVDALKDNTYRLTHRYATANSDDKLFFQVSRDGSITLQKNSYSNHYSHYVSMFLERADSYPAFLAAITLDLLKSVSQSVDMSMDMSTTIMQNTLKR